MKNYMDPAKYADIQKLLDKADDAYAKVYASMNQAHIRSLEATIDTDGLIEEFRQKVITNRKRLMALQAEMKTYLAEYEAAHANGNFSDSSLDRYVYGAFGTLATVTAVDYTAYETYRYAYSDKTFLDDYNDMPSFFNTKLYKKVVDKVGFSEIANKDLWLGRYDAYTNEMLESAMASILESIPGHEPQITSEDTFDSLSNMTGIPEMGKWVSMLKSILSKYASEKVPFDVLEHDETVKAILEMWPPEERGVFVSQLAKAYNAAVFADKLDTISNGVEVLDLTIDSLMHCFNNYAAQVAYLESMENALLNAGYSYGPVMEMIGELKSKYADEFTYVMDGVHDYVVDKVIDGTTDKVIDIVSKKVPIIKDVNFGLKVIDTAADILFADEIAAYKGLSGLRQYDEVLTKSYENYVQMMKDGLATEADMAEADRILTILTATKAKEYKYMMDLCYEKDVDLYIKYKRKYEALTNGTAFSDNAAGGGGRF